MITQCGGRRFVLTLGCGIACSLLLWFGKLDAVTFRDIVIATIGVYIAGNTYQKVRNAAQG